MFPDIFIRSIIWRKQDIPYIAVNKLLIPSKIVRRKHGLRIHRGSRIELAEKLGTIRTTTIERRSVRKTRILPLLTHEYLIVQGMPRLNQRMIVNRSDD